MFRSLLEELAESMRGRGYGAGAPHLATNPRDRQAVDLLVDVVAYLRRETGDPEDSRADFFPPDAYPALYETEVFNAVGTMSARTLFVGARGGSVHDLDSIDLLVKLGVLRGVRAAQVKSLSLLNVEAGLQAVLAQERPLLDFNRNVDLLMAPGRVLPPPAVDLYNRLLAAPSLAAEASPPGFASLRDWITGQAGQAAGTVGVIEFASDNHVLAIGTTAGVWLLKAMYRSSVVEELRTPIGEAVRGSSRQVGGYVAERINNFAHERLPRAGGGN